LADRSFEAGHIGRGYIADMLDSARLVSGSVLIHQSDRVVTGRRQGD
jgi:hypothetical protein